MMMVREEGDPVPEGVEYHNGLKKCSDKAL
jgi:hypothetical protein